MPNDHLSFLKSLGTFQTGGFAKSNEPQSGHVTDRHTADGGKVSHHMDFLRSMNGFADGGNVDRDLNQYGLYSKAAEVAQAAKGQNESMTPAEWEKYLVGRGVKPDEIKWSHFHQGFSPDEKVHKDDVAGHFNYMNSEPYTEKLYSDENAEYTNSMGGFGELAWNILRDPDLALTVLGPKKQKQILSMDEDEAYDYLLGEFEPYLRDYIENHQENSPTRHSDYQMQGDAKNYRELVLQHDPDNQKFLENGHFPDSNPLLHIRMSDRQGLNGEKLLHIEELQSDWGQQGRRAGFNEEDKKEREKKWHKAQQDMHELDLAMRNKYRKILEQQGGLQPHRIDSIVDQAGLKGIVLTYGTPEEKEQHRKMEEAERTSRHNFLAPVVEEGPHVNDTNKWVDLGLKRILKEAADGGYDGITFAPGDQQASRWHNKGLIKPYDETIPNRMQKLLTKIDPQLKFGSYSMDMPIWKDEQYNTVSTQRVHHVPLNEMHHAEIQKGFERFKRGGLIKGRHGYSVDGGVPEAGSTGSASGNSYGGGYSANGGEDSPSESARSNSGNGNNNDSGSSFSSGNGNDGGNSSVSSGNGRDSASSGPSLGFGAGIGAPSAAPSTQKDMLGNEGAAPNGPFGFGATADVGKALVANVLGGGNATATAPVGISNFASSPTNPGYTDIGVTAMRTSGDTASNLANLQSLDPSYGTKAATLINRAIDKGYNPTITSAARTLADQARINNDPNQQYPSAAPGQSMHNYGLAIDLGNMTPSQQANLGKMAAQEGIQWGGTSDPVHFGLNKEGMSAVEKAASLGAGLYSGAKSAAVGALDAAKNLLGITPAYANDTTVPALTRSVSAPTEINSSQPQSATSTTADIAAPASSDSYWTPDKWGQYVAGQIEDRGYLNTPTEGSVPGMSQYALDQNKLNSQLANPSDSLFGSKTNAGINNATNQFLSGAEKMTSPQTQEDLTALDSAINYPLIGGMIGRSYGVQQATPQQEAQIANVMSQMLDPNAGYTPPDFGTPEQFLRDYGYPAGTTPDRAGSMGSVSPESFADSSGNVPLPPERPSEMLDMSSSTGRQNYESKSSNESVRSSFDKAFAAARESGSPTFQWRNPITGKVGLYTTELKATGGPVKSSVSKNAKLLHSSPAVEIALSKVSSLPLDAAQMIKNGTRGRS